MTNSPAKTHWENIYSTKEENELGWYQPKAAVSLQMILKYLPGKGQGILDVGSGASVLVDDLLSEGYTKIYAADLSAAALEKSKTRLGTSKAGAINWVVDDVTASETIKSISGIDFWHDRAVFHFLLKEDQKQAYKQLLKKVLAPGGYALIATFRTGGAKKCSGLDIYQYDSASLASFMGSDFDLMESHDHLHYNPKGEERPFVYAVFKRK